MMTATQEITVHGVPHAFGATAIAEKRWGSGFVRAIGLMHVYRLETGGFVAHYKDTAANLDKATRVEEIEELSGFFGFCPRAVLVYEELGIPVRPSPGPAT